MRCFLMDKVIHVIATFGKQSPNNEGIASQRGFDTPCNEHAGLLNHRRLQ
jgi:hypothetical protein